MPLAPYPSKEKGTIHLKGENKDSIQPGYPHRTRLYAVRLYFSPSFPSVADFRCPSATASTDWKGERFSGGIRSNLFEEDCARNGLPPRPFDFHPKAVLTFAGGSWEICDRRNGKNRSAGKRNTNGVLVVPQKIVPLFQDELCIDANRVSM